MLQRASIRTDFLDVDVCIEIGAGFSCQQIYRLFFRLVINNFFIVLPNFGRLFNQACLNVQTEAIRLYSKMIQNKYIQNMQ